jgi:hypothetical protein
MSGQEARECKPNPPCSENSASSKKADTEYTVMKADNRGGFETERGCCCFKAQALRKTDGTGRADSAQAGWNSFSWVFVKP